MARALRVIACEDCSAGIETSAWNRKVCDDCGNAREAVRRKDWWARNQDYGVKRYAADAERFRQEARDRYESDPEHGREIARRWRERNPQTVIEYAREYRRNNPEKVREYMRQWYARNPDAAAIYSARRKSRKLNAGGNFTREEFADMCASYNGCCAYCHQPCAKLTIDHVMPLSLGGSNGIENIVPACLSCNVKKQARTPAEFLWAEGRVA